MYGCCIAVSYTHLDVYKRQLFHPLFTVKQIALRFERDTDFYITPFCVSVALPVGGEVLYTFVVVIFCSFHIRIQRMCATHSRSV